ncbi:MAG: chromosome segregation protein SMC [Candidatus Tyrphobacter sp.]
MKLKRIKAFGFKTFADPTTVEFPSGVTAIVGPNGSGKSNLVDAFRWVLGETSTRSLRSGKLEDVIFAGNERRKPLGLAEVSITFDNEDRTLGIQFGEVEITRRAYRAGESEYFINRTPVRLRDIHDLLMGTGLGPGSYAIVSQGEIDAVLRSKPTERRELFEETAGISKFLARKHESMRRLEQTEANAIRISDLIAETQRRIPELETQVRRAKRFRRVTARVRDLEILSYLRASATRRREREELREALKEHEEARTVVAARVSTAGARLAAARTQLYRCELELEELRSQAQSRRADVSKTEAEYAAALARHQALESQSTQTSHDVARVEQERTSIVETLARFDDELAPLAQEAASAHERELAATAALAQARGRLDAIFTQLREVEADAVERAAAQAERRVQGETLRAEVERCRAELETVLARRGALELALGASQQRLEESEKSVEALESAVAQSQAESEAAERLVAQCAEDLERAQSIERRTADEVTAAQTRLHTIEELENGLEGHVPGTRAVVEAWQRGELGGIEGVVANLITIDEPYAHAMDVAFGARLSHIVTKTTADAERAIEYLNRSERGRATFVPLDRTTRYAAPPMALTKERGAIGYACSLIRTNDAYAGVIESLVGDVLVVDTLATAMRIVRASAPPVTIVTLAGEMVAEGQITGGRFARERSILSRRAQAEQLRAQLRDAHARLAECESGVASARQRVQEGENARDAVRAESSANELQRAEARAQAASRRAECERTSGELERVGAAAEEIAERVRVALERDARLRTGDGAGDRSDGERHRLEGELTRARAEIATFEEALALQTSQAGSVREHLASLNAQKEAGSARLGMLDQDDERARAAREHMLAEVGTLGAEIDALHGRLEALRESVRAVDAALERAREARETAVQQQTILEEELHTSELDERETIAQGESGRTRMAQIEAELGMVVAQFAQNPATESECADVEERYRGEPDALVEDVPRLRDELARLGANVNLNAEAEREELAQREQFLQTQLDDLSRARETLLASIEEIETQTQATFNETFERVAREFTNVYARLVQGGVARMWQTSPERLSETGIEIEVQPPGKKQMPLPALSGGERAMVAAALIFALIAVKPAPFYLLDEVDAALDDVNVGRFGDMVRELSSGADTIIVTHNKTTMEHANRMYGVTMSESGITSIISAELTRQAEQAIA